MRIWLICLPTVLSLGFTMRSLQAATLAFPGAEGAGAYATGGRGGDVYRVTNLLDEDGNGSPIPGSLRYGVENATGPRTIIFDVSGTIEMTDRLKVDRPNITIAGQTAPGDGICLKNWHVTMEANNVIMRYLRIRPGHGANYVVIVNQPAKPVIQSATFSNRQFSLRITGAFGPDYKVQASTNLSSPGNWITVFTTNSPVPPVRWTDTTASNFLQRFYRVQLGP